MKRDLLFGAKTATAAEWKSLGERFLAEDWFYDGIDFLTQAGDRVTLASLTEKAAEEGNVFLVLKAFRSLGVGELDESQRAILLKCSEKAEALGKNRYAMKGYEKLSLQDRFDRVKALVANDGDILAEAETQVFIPAMEEEADGEEAE